MDDSWDNKGPTFGGKRDAVRRYRKALLHTGMMNELFIEQIAKGEVSEEYVIEAFESFRRAMNPEDTPVESEYVLGFMFDPEKNKVLLMWKNRPTWQSGKLNGIGGKIEPGETPQEAMDREFREETFFVAARDNRTEEVLVPYWHYVGKRQRNALEPKQPGSYIMHVFACEFPTFLADFENGGAKRNEFMTEWKVASDLKNREEIINLPMNLEIIRRRGVPGLAWTVDAAFCALREGFNFHVEDMPNMLAGTD